ncbi:hypothetical protein HIM_07318 [Hirsutella minnesotensis 3608]|uniref:Proteinase inhibitor I78 n=1 Tax=Hirsutella minnesotensis 3608 TaxID=1043627 RepID=A0A0F8A4C0_9HYPO|nr:hypothetical protein HIM_07318 [Hirsutella minnesotensis 3608]
MPLVVPGVTNVSANDANAANQQWTDKLVGKTLSDSESNETMFCKKDLPKEHRIVAPGDLVTKDFNENRLNIHLNEDGVVSHVLHG